MYILNIPTIRFDFADLVLLA